MIKTLICFSTFIAFGICLSLTPVSWEKCGVNPDVKSIDVTPCTAEPCDLQMGSTYNTKTLFTSNHDTEPDCKLEFKALLGGGWVQISNEDVCGASTLPCPLVKGSDYILDKDLIFDDPLPDGVTQTEWTVTCNRGADQIICARITLNIKS